MSLSPTAKVLLEVFREAKGPVGLKTLMRRASDNGHAISFAAAVEGVGELTLANALERTTDGVSVLSDKWKLRGAA